MPTSGSTSLATAMGMIHRVHCNAANFRPLAKPARTPCLAQTDLFVVYVSNLTYRGITILKNHTHFTRGKFYLGIAALFCHKLGECTSTSRKLSAFSKFEFYIMNDRTKRNSFQGQSITRLNICFRTADNSIAHLQIKRGQDIPFFSIHIVEKCDSCTSIRIIFNTCDLRRNTDFISAEINDAIFLLMPSALMPGGDPTQRIPAA